jgi:hypothetical protein
MIVIEDKSRRVVLITFAADSSVTGTKVTIGQIVWHFGCCAVDRFADPWTILSMRSDYDPLFAQRMPPLFPGHNLLNR